MNRPVSDISLFRTERLQLASYLHATELLPFIGCDSETGRHELYLLLSTRPDSDRNSN